MTLAAFTDANRYLDTDKVQFENVTDAVSESTDADRYVRASLYDVFGTQITTWAVSPSGGQVAPPEIVTEITAMFMAAYRYEKLYSLETGLSSDYATALMARAQGLLDKIRSGELSVIEAIVSGVSFSEADFWPNNKTLDPITGDPNIKFTMDKKF